MKLSELRPCDQCGKPVSGESPLGCFTVVRVSQAMVKPEALQQVTGLMQIWGKGTPQALRVAETFAPQGDDAVLVFGDREAALTTELLLCMDCATGNVSILTLVEKRNEACRQALANAETTKLSAVRSAGAST